MRSRQTWRIFSRSANYRVKGHTAGVLECVLKFVREAFGWDAEVTASEGPRGALGRIWRLSVGPDRFALKEIFAEPPSEALIATELAFARRAAAAGVHLPASHADRA